MTGRQLEGQVALVTGAAQGIGAAIAEALVAAGATVVLNDRELSDTLRQTAARLEAHGGTVDVVAGDVSRVADVQRSVNAVVERFGRIDLLVNNAGGGDYTAPADIDEASWDHTLDVHLKGPFFAAQAAAKHMFAQDGGKIVNIASEQAYIGYDVLAHYTAAKAGLLTLTRSLALAWAPTIKVNAVCPGPTDTPRLRSGHEFTPEVRDTIPLKRFGLPRDVALSVLFLAGEGGDFYTGQHLDPNGGTVMP